MVQNKYREIATRSLTAKAIFYVLGCRERNRKTIGLTRLRSDIRSVVNGPIDSKDFLNTIKSLEAAGAGRIHYGVRGAAKYFSWTIKILDVAKQAHVTKEDLLAATVTRMPSVPSPIAMTSLPRIVNGERVESPVTGRRATDMKNHVVFVLPDGSIKKMDLSSELNDSVLTDIARIFIKDSQGAESQTEAGSNKDVRTKGNVSGMSN